MSVIRGSAHIVPFNFMQLGLESSTFSMVLTHLVLESNEYANFYANTGKPVLLDNSFFELGESLSDEKVLEAANRIKADCVVARDGEMDSVEFFKSKGFEVMYVPKDLKDLGEALMNDDIDKVGISCITSQKMIGKSPFEPCRAEVVSEAFKLVSINATAITPNKIHLLGATNGYLSDLVAFNKLSPGFSIDTSFAFTAALKGVRLTLNTERCGELVFEEPKIGKSEMANFQGYYGWNVLQIKQAQNYGIAQGDFLRELK